MHLAGRVLLLTLVATAWPQAGWAQCVDSSQVNGFKVHSVKFSSLFGGVPSTLQQQLDAHRGDAYSADRAKQYMDEIDSYLNNDAVQQKYERLIANELKLSIKGAKTDLQCVEKVAPAECEKSIPGSTQCVDVSLKRYSVEIDALNSSPFFLLLPPSALTTVYDTIPRPLLALNPGFDFNIDRRFGASAGVDTATNLLDLPSLLRKNSAQPVKPPSPPSPPSPAVPGQLDVTFPVNAGNEVGAARDSESNDTKLLLKLESRKSLNKSFYDTNSKLVLKRTKAPLDVYQALALEAGFEARNVPLGEGRLRRNGGTFGFSHDVRPKSGPVKFLNLGGKYRQSSDRLFGGGSSPRDTGKENALETRAIADGSFGKGLARAAFWFDAGALDRDRGSYERIAGLFGYGKEIVIPHKKEFRKIKPPELGGAECWTSYREDPKRNEQAVGVELLAGGGRAWGSVPQQAAFFGGNASGQFLYDELSAASLTSFPSGPILRSLGQNQAGVTAGTGTAVRGGTSYWHSNLNVSVPIPGWSRPLIPHEWVTHSRMMDAVDEEFKGHVPEGAEICRDLKRVITTLVGVSGVNLLISQQARDELTDAQKQDLRLANKPNRTPEEDKRLMAAQSALAAAKAKVKPVVEDIFDREIFPVTSFIANHANLIAVKPLVLFDAAHLGLTGSAKPTRYAAGRGLQVDLVTARFEFAYVAALNRVPGDPSGHFVVRLVLRRFL
jgi:hypothetical protein